MLASFSLRGLYNYDPTIFEGLVLPEGADKETLIDHLMIEYGECASLYTDPHFLRGAITSWSKVNAYFLEKSWKSTTFEYNPIWNKDGTITDTRTPDLHYHSENGGSSTTENSVSADNVAAYAPDRKSVTTPATTSDTAETGTETTTRRETGNIGVTSTQSLILEERKVADYSFYKAAADLFAQDLLICIF